MHPGSLPTRARLLESGKMYLKKKLILLAAFFSLTASFTKAARVTQISGCLGKMEPGDLSPGCGDAGGEESMDLPPGFRFHPTDEELITHYLSNKLLDSSFVARAISDVDLNKCEPWELPRKAKMGEKEWYFFCVRDRKYPTGLRTNRATDAGYWKATGKDREIHRGKVLVGMKKTLVFYRGRAPRGEKTNWVMHEYRLEGKYSVYSLTRAAKNEWVICRVFKKSSVGNGKKAFGMTKIGSSSSSFGEIGEDLEGGRPPPATLPPLMDIPCAGKENLAHVTCFSIAPEGPKAPDSELFSAMATTQSFNPSPDTPALFFSMFMPLSTSLYSGIAGGGEDGGGGDNGNGSFMSLLEGDGFSAKQESKAEREMLSISQETGLTSDMNPEISSEHEIGRKSFEECFWHY